jgi:hypothetical protein
VSYLASKDSDYMTGQSVMVDDDLDTSRVSLSDIVEQGFEELVENRDRHVKILVQPSR